jgi:chemotaxis protein methyltransferase CheR
MHENELSDKDFHRFRKLVYEKAGINLHEGKKELVRSRLGKRLRHTNFKSLNEYYEHLVNEDNGEELVQMLDAISTNLTSFFREIKHFEFLEKKIIPDYLNNGTMPSKVVNLWSAGCSSGEEPYSLFICLNEALSPNGNWKINILATDISTKVLSSARAGVYTHSRIQSIPNPLLRKYFQRGRGKWQGHYRVKPFVRNAIEFKRFNLMDPFPFKERFHIIFCRNVMIYFDREFQQKLVNKFYDGLVDHGYLFIGHSESLMGTTHKFQYVKPTIYSRSDG